MAKSKSLRTLFARVSQTNNTENGVISYNDDDIKAICDRLNGYSGVEYAYIRHNADDEVSMTHWHIVARFKSPVPFMALKEIIPYGQIESAKNFKKAMQYLVHMNDL